MMRTVKLTTKYDTRFTCVCGCDTFKAENDTDNTSELYHCVVCGMYCGSNKLKNHASEMFSNYTYATEVNRSDG